MNTNQRSFDARKTQNSKIVWQPVGCKSMLSSKTSISPILELLDPAMCIVKYSNITDFICTSS